MNCHQLRKRVTTLKRSSATLILAVCLAFLLPLLSLAQDREALPSFNQKVLAMAASYPTDGTHNYWWPRSGESSYDGSSMDVMLMGKRVMRGEEQKRTFCCGLTLEVFARVYDEWLMEQPEGFEPPVTPDNWRDFQRVWFVLEANGPGPSAALEKYGIGRQIQAHEALPGDFVQIWRTSRTGGQGSGYSVVFLDWVRNDAGKVVGMKYWSTQPGTNGINENIEYYGPMGGMSTEYTTFGRVELDGKKA